MISSGPIISAEAVDHFFGTGALRKQILFEITANFYPGEIVILTGPSGSGKTTLLTLAGALRSVQEGSLKVLGHQLNNAEPEALGRIRRQIGFIFQAHNLINSLTARKNVQMALALDPAMTRAEADRRAEEILGAVGLKDRIDYFPKELSGGQKQRVAIARALANRPRLVLADEPTAALDKKSGREVVDLLHDLAKKQAATILMVTHDNRILDVADRILTLEDGRISSFAQGAAAATGSMLRNLAAMNKRGKLAHHVQDLPPDRFFGFLKKSTGELTDLLDTLQQAQAELSDSVLDQVIESVTTKMAQLLDADRAALFLVDKPNRRLVSKMATHEDGSPLMITMSMDEGIAGHVARTGETVNLADVRSSPLFNDRIDRVTGYETRNMLCVPVRDQKGTIFAVAQFLNKRSGPAFGGNDEKSFRDFVGPLGVMLDISRRLTDGIRHSEPDPAEDGNSDSGAEG